MPSMPSVNDQWNAVFATPLPFVLAVIAVATLVWGAMPWRYKGANEKLAELYDLLNKKAEIQNEAAAKVQNELKETIASLRMQIEQAQIDKQGTTLIATHPYANDGSQEVVTTSPRVNGR